MSLKLLAILASISFCCQVGFSIFYSAKIIDENISINNLENKLNQLTIQNQQLEIKLSLLNSLPNIIPQTVNQLYLPIYTSLNLK